MNKPYTNLLNRKHKLLRLSFNVVWALFVRWLPRGFGFRWIRFILRMFGADITKTSVIYSSAIIYYPPYLKMKEYSCLGPQSVCYNVDVIELGQFATVSQGAFLCTASHNITSSKHELIHAPIIIKDLAWIGAKAYIGMGVTVGEGAVVGATSSVYKNVDPWNVVGGNPAKFLKTRVIKDA